MSIGGLAFLNPALLAGLLALPVIWWLLRAVPPAPVRILFPATRILVGLPNTEKQSDRTPCPRPAGVSAFLKWSARSASGIL